MLPCVASCQYLHILTADTKHFADGLVYIFLAAQATTSLKEKPEELSQG
jgi:hypothetical protein